MSTQQIIDKVVNELFDRKQQAGYSMNTPHCNWCWVCPECRSQVVEEIVENGANRVGATGPDLGPLNKNLAKHIDHTLLKADATEQEITKLCSEAAQHGFASVCVNPTWVRLCRDLLRRSDVLVCTVVGFPLGATTPEAKSYETQKAVEQGADEIDMVINIGRLKSCDYDAVEQDVRAVVEAAGKRGEVKVILETCYLDDHEKIKACLLAQKAGAAFVKTSTGFGKQGATLGDVALMRKIVGSQLGVKAAGGIRDFEDAMEMIEAGASRLGASASIAIIGK